MPFTEMLGLEVESGAPQGVIARLFDGAGRLGGRHLRYSQPPRRGVDLDHRVEDEFLQTRHLRPRDFQCHLGARRSLIVVQTDATDADGKLVARTFQTQAVISAD